MTKIITQFCSCSFMLLVKFVFHFIMLSHLFKLFFLQLLDFIIKLFFSLSLPEKKKKLNYDIKELVSAVLVAVLID